MHVSVVDSDCTRPGESASIGGRLRALLRERHAAPHSGAAGAAPAPVGARRSSYLTAASIAAGLIAAWAGLCFI